MEIKAKCFYCGEEVIVTDELMRQYGVKCDKCIDKVRKKKASLLQQRGKSKDQILTKNHN